jgi:hypothetical protein
MIFIKIGSLEEKINIFILDVYRLYERIEREREWRVEKFFIKIHQ